jgi:hypothetical protein
MAASTSIYGSKYQEDFRKGKNDDEGRYVDAIEIRSADT